MATPPKVEVTNEFCFLYSTYPNTDTATTAARFAIERKLAACVNIYPPMKSIYLWDDKQTEEGEVAVFFKTRRSLVERAIAELWSVHKYSVPCFVVLPIEGGSTDYLAWVRAQTEQPLTA